MSAFDRNTSLQGMFAFRAMALLALALLFCLSHAGAQQDVGSITGNVTDQNGAAVAGAAVHITNENNGLAVDVTTSSVGNYQADRLQVGNYTVRIAAQGFATWVAKGVVVDVAAHVAENAVLQVGTETTTVSVEAAPPSLNTSDAIIGNTIDTRGAQQLPVNGRSVLALATLVPGVESGVGAVSQGFTNRGTAVASIRISGGVMGVNNNLLDGVTNVTTFTSEIGINLKSDGVQEYRIMTGVIPAQFGYTSGGVINVVTRGGGDKYHGSLYEFLRNDAFDAEIAFPRPVFGKPELHFNNYGGTFSGPVPHMKNIFTFFNYEQFHYTSVTPSYASVPTEQEYTGDFSDLGVMKNGVCTQVPIYDPATASNTGSRTQFVSNGVLNVIPTSQLDFSAVAYQKLFYPKANNTSGSYNSCTHANNYIMTPKQISDEKLGLARVDYRLSPNDNLVARYGYYKNSQNNAQGYSAAFNRNDNDQTQNALLAETHVFSPTLINEIRFGLERTDFLFASAQVNKDNVSAIGMPSFLGSNQTALQVNNGMAIPYATVGFRANTIGELIDNTTLIHGKHTLTAGVAVRFTETYNYQNNYGSGSFGFISGTTAAGNNTSITSGTGSTYASFLIGAVNSAGATPVAGSAWRRMMYAAYMQDDWRPTPRLTINAGLRYDYMANAYAKQNMFTNVDLSKANGSNPALMGLVEYAGRDGYGRDFSHENPNDWGPRLGFAYLLTPNGKTVVRGGAAIYYVSTSGMEYNGSNGSTNGFNSLATGFNSSTTYGVLSTFHNGMPGAIAPVAGYALWQTGFLGQPVYTVAPDAKDPSSQQYTLTVSRELPHLWVVDVSYIGNSGHHFVFNTYNVNFLNPKYYSLGTAYLNAQSNNPYAGMVPGSLGSSKLTNAQLLKPYPYYSAVYPSYYRGGSYHGDYMYVTVQRRAQRGLSVMAAFTMGKLMDLPIFTDLSTTPGGGISTSNGPQNPWDMKSDYAVDTFDVNKRLTTSVLYDLPFGKGQRFLNGSRLWDGLAGGWQYNVIMTLESGRPLQFSGASNQGIASRPSFKPGVDVKAAHQSRSQWFNPQAFINPADYSFGNVPRTYTGVRGPAQVNFDMSVFKSVHLPGETALEVRIEAFNALNHVNLQGPNTSFSAGPPADPSNPYAEGGTNTNSNFGVITSANAARTVQLGAKFRF
ncbi:MAG: carboxypeptidase regulatory-like domain-containing protein [Terracidiphilus sp.]|nr:carboxypeptidase regulatory-like domain-containing protein [Terracidiphilus sp.]